MNVLTLVLVGDAVVVGAVVLFVVRGRRRRAREEAAAAAEAAAAEAAAAASDSRDEEVTYPIAVHLRAAEQRGYEAGIKRLREATQPPVWQYRSRRRQPHHDMTQLGTPAQRQNDERTPYDPWRPPQDLEVGD
jgi:hypothetical protein